MFSFMWLAGVEICFQMGEGGTGDHRTNHANTKIVPTGLNNNFDLACLFCSFWLTNVS